MSFPLAGVFAAAVTPLKPSGAPDLDALPGFLEFLANRGCHGALILGTTGEGPSFSFDERLAIWRAAVAGRPKDFILMAGTGTPSLAETIALNQTAFDLGYEAVVVLPPYFFRNASEDGLFTWFSQVIEQSVPEGHWLLGYHIPAVSGVSLSVGLLQRLNTAFPSRFGGLKDSTGDFASAKAYVAALPGKSVLVGNDKLMALGLLAGAAGCITALANTRSPELRAIHDAHARGEANTEMQAALDLIRNAMDAMPPAPAYLKALLHAQHDFPLWPVRPPLQDFSLDQTHQALSALEPISTGA
jgi:4-hydroxy-tetrahydrodipicolinate synthase